ncbi:MAG: anthranilate synthase component I family protein [Actinobacteria bacterium]|nr:anthranilate synthase component I family protein [Actinomycetota bacterium]
MGSSSEKLELHEPEEAFRRIEEWLRARGFFEPGGERLAADLYLGYGLSHVLRRERTPAPPEPCRLPLAACEIRRETTLVAQSHNELELGAWEPTWAAAEYAAAVERVREAIARGDVYQVNLVQHLSAPIDGHPRALAGSVAARLGHLGPLHREPFVGESWAVVSASPELFLERSGRRVRTMPIKGTRPRGGGAELRESAKDVAEHVMIVDLERNDLSRVCEAGTIRWPELMATRELAGVEHMVSTVEGTLRRGVELAELLEATFPGGSVTGAPKIAALDLIAGLEPVGRGASMGALGRVYGNGDLELALTIRTFAVAGGRIHLWVGGGVVWDSEPLAEVEESWTKARPLLDALGMPQPVSVP